MSYIINNPASGGANSFPFGVTFDNALVDYGGDFEQLNNEIKADLLREIVTVTQTASFDRGSGIGIDLYENETLSEINKIKMRLDIMAAAERFNSKVTSNKKIIISQEMIDIDGSGGEVIINIFYMVESLISPNQGTNNIQNITIP